MPETFAIKLAGPAGSGILSAGEIIFRALVATGYYALGYPEYPSLIKGGHNSYLITLSDKAFPNNSPRLDLLLALTQAALDEEYHQVGESTKVITDSGIRSNHSHPILYQPSLLDVARDAGNPLTLNTAMTGFVAHQLQLDSALVWNLIKDELADKPTTVIAQNQAAFQKAQELSLKYHLDLRLPAKNNSDQHLCFNGNEAVGLGAIAAGLNLYAGYPMTPSSPLLHFLATHQTEFDYLVRQTEDEIAAINLIIGASFAGARSMTGTSGGGFALMQEGLSLAGMLETPIVVFLGQRPAPATGLPTWTSQADLLFAIHAGHGEFPKIVLAPSDPTSCYLITHQAFSLAQTYHCPVIILSDKFLAESKFSTSNLPPLEPVPISAITPSPKNDEMYSRYAFTPDGVHPRTLPGMPRGEYIANSDEHNAIGLVDESVPNRLANNQRRLNKMGQIKHNQPQPEVYGVGDRALITWGSHKYIGRAIAQELKLVHIHFTYLWPLPDGLDKLLAVYRQLIVVENNETHQLASLLSQETNLKVHLTFGHDSGRPLDPAQLIEQISNS